MIVTHSWESLAPIGCIALKAGIWASTPGKVASQAAIRGSVSKVAGSGGGVSATLKYDPASRLYEVAGTSETRFLYDGADLIAEYDGAGNLLRRHVRPADARHREGDGGGDRGEVKGRGRGVRFRTDTAPIVSVVSP